MTHKLSGCLALLAVLFAAALFAVPADAQCPGGICHASPINQTIYIPSQSVPRVIASPRYARPAATYVRPYYIQPVPNPRFCSGPNCFGRPPAMAAMQSKRTFGVSFHSQRYVGPPVIRR